MDLVTLDPATFMPAKMVEQYDSLIWTERFNTVSEFQIKTGLVEEFMDLLPEGTWLSLRESTEPMVVETHQIERKKNSPAVLTIQGRGMESLLDRRQALSSLTPGSTSDWAVVAKTPSDVAYYIMKKICVDGMLDSRDIFEPSIVQFPTPADYLTSTGPNRNFLVPRGNLLSQVLTLLQTEAKADPSTTPATPAVVQHGIRGRRPASAGAMAIELYTGTDRTATIRFDANRRLLNDGTYLFSKVGSATDAYVLGPSLTYNMSKSTSPASGINRRVILVDATSSTITDGSALQAQGNTSLAEAHETAIFDGSINEDINPYTFGVDYFLGDIVNLIGDYGLSERARVTEFIRAKDATGIKRYPTLVTLDQ
jgi:hypothetical protein